MSQIDDPVKAVVRKVAEDERVSSLAELVREITPLTETGGWQALKKHFEGFKKDSVDVLSRRILAGERYTEQNIGFVRGYAQAIEDFFALPEQVVKDLDKAALRAFNRAAEELSQEEELNG